MLVIAALSVAVVLIAVVVLRSVGGRTRTGVPDQSRPGAVLLVPGYGGSQASLSRLADRLRAAGRAVTVVAPPGDGTGDLRVQADSLDRAVRRALRDGAPSVDIVGYSAGGVVVRLWLDRHDGASAARRLVSLGSPHHGAQIAAAGVAVGSDACPPACQQLVPGSDLLDRLNDTPPPVPWLSVWTEDDETVRPPESARMEGAVNVAIQGLCPGARVSHGQLTTDPLVTALVLRALGPQPLTVPADCAALRS